MIIKEYKTEQEWIEARKGKVTGTKLNGLVVKRGNNKKIGFYELIAEKVMLDDGIELDPMNRGTYLEGEALDIFADNENKELDKRKVLCMRDDNENIANSPDALIGDTEAVEAKCLSAARHIEAYITKEIPSDYMMQGIQYFIVNDKLETLYFVFYDPRMPDPIDYFFIELKRGDIEKEISEYYKYQLDALKEINEWVAKLTNF